MTLVDIQTAAPAIDEALGSSTARRLFRFRSTREWPPAVRLGETWPTLYRAAAGGLPVLQDAAEAVAWTNDYVARLADILD
jgi:hypothetical protein